MYTIKKTVQYLKNIQYFKRGLVESSKSMPVQELSRLLRVLSATLSILNEPHKDEVRGLVQNLESILPLLCLHLDQCEQDYATKVWKIMNFQFPF